MFNLDICSYQSLPNHIKPTGTIKILDPETFLEFLEQIKIRNAWKSKFGIWIELCYISYVIDIMYCMYDNVKIMFPAAKIY